MTMELQDGSEMRPRRAWQAAIDARLVARLVRPLQPGLIGMGLARRIVGGVEAMAGRLGLLARFSRGVRGQGAKDSPTIVHALWPRTPREASAAERRGTVDRVDVRDAAPRAAVRPVVSARVVEAERLHERLTERSTAPLAETTLVERVAAGTALSRVAAVSAGATASALMSRGVAAAHAPSGGVAAAHAATSGVAAANGASGGVAAASGSATPPAGDPVRRTRLGAPLATPPIETTLVERVAAGTAPSRVAAASAGATASALMTGAVAAANGPSRGVTAAPGSATPPAGEPPVRRAPLGAPLAKPVHVSAPAVHMTGASRGAHGRTGDASPTREQSRPRTDEGLGAPAAPHGSLAVDGAAPRRAVVHPRRSATSALIASEWPVAHVAPPAAVPLDAAVTARQGRMPSNRVGRHATNPGALVLPHHTARATEPAVPVALPRRASPGVRTSGDLPLAPVAMSPAGAPTAASPGAPPAAPAFAAPAGPPPQRSILVGPPPGTPEPPRLDLREIATQVQRILAREAVHERARRGLRR